ncbi:MAG: hypothetical protein P9M03_12090 [Candidatus Theseobacter exili]|nr:hypothetical protein [Candidatus Theseobacter exili]
MKRINRKHLTSIVGKTCDIGTGILVVACVLIFLPVCFSVYEYPKYVLIEFGICLLFAFRCFEFLLKKQLKIPYGSITIVVFCLVIPYTVSLIFSGFTVTAVSEYIHLLLYIIFFLTIATSRNTFFIQKSSINILVLCGAIVSLYGILQYLGIDIIHVKKQFRPISTLGHVNYAAQFIVMVLPLAMISIWKNGKLAGKSFSAVSFFLMFIHLCITGSRGGYVAFAASFSIGCFFIWRASEIELKTKMRTLYVGIVIVVLIVVGIVAIGRRYSKEPNRTVVSRAMSIFDVSQKSTQFRLMTWKEQFI